MINAINGPDNQAAETESLTREIKWQLYTLNALSSSYFIASILLLITFNHGFWVFLALIPLCIYDGLRIVVCVLRICRGEDSEMKDEVKDIIERGLMCLYKVCLPAQLEIDRNNRKTDRGRRRQHLPDLADMPRDHSPCGHLHGNLRGTQRTVRDRKHRSESYRDSAEQGSESSCWP